MKKQYAVIGLGRFGSEIARILAKNKYNVIAVDRNEHRVKDLADIVTLAVQLDATDEKALREAGIQNVDLAIVSIGEHIESSILVVMLLKDIGVKNIIAKAMSDLHGRILSQLGVSRVVHPERDMAQKVAFSLMRSNILELIELSPEYSIAEIPAHESLWNKSILDINLRAKYGLTIIAINNVLAEDSKTAWNINPYPSDVIQKGDTLVVLGRNSDIEKFGRIMEPK